MNRSLGEYVPCSLPACATLLLIPFALVLALGSQLAVAEPVRVPTVLVQSRTVGAGFSADGRVEAVRSATLAAQIAGRISEVRVDVGQRVKQGETLMRIDARELAGSDAASQAQLAQARAAWERSQQLFRQKFISQSALDQAQLAYKAAQGGALASSASLSHATVIAPFSGVVAQRFVEAGEMAAPGRQLISIFDPAELRVVVELPETRAAALKLDGGARVNFGGSDRTVLAARVERLPTADPESHTVTVRLYWPKAGGQPQDAGAVSPGQAVRVTFATGAAEAVAVPAQAVVHRGEVVAVYVIDAAGKAKLRQVRLGELLPDGSIEVLAGLHAGERVASEPLKATFSVH